MDVIMFTEFVAFYKHGWYGQFTIVFKASHLIINGNFTIVFKAYHLIINGNSKNKISILSLTKSNEIEINDI